MIVGVLGPLYVRGDDGTTAALSGPVRKAIFAALVSKVARSVPGENLIEDVWGIAPPPTARKTLQSHMVRLRRDLAAVGGANIRVTDGSSYRLAIEPSAVDANCFERDVALGTAALAADDPVTAQRLLDAAVARWRGVAYAEFSEQPFALTARRRLDELLALAHERRFEASLRAGRGASLVGEIESRLLLDPFRERLWEQLMTALYRAERQRDALAAYGRARETLLGGLGVEPGAQLRAMHHRVLAQDDSLRSGDGRADASNAPLDVLSGDAEAVCPYLGLESYGESDSAVFVARETLSARLVARLQSTGFLVITGDSGAGKSSLVRAGLLPSLASGALPGSASWATAVCRPSGLTGVRGTDLVVIDQGEELFTSDAAEPEIDEFDSAAVNLLKEGARVVLVIRADFYGRLAELPQLAGRVGAATELVPAMTESELQRVITEPAGRSGAGVEPELVERILADVRGQVGALPLLSVALQRTWQKRRSSTMTLSAYEQAGGVTGALEATAENTIAGLSEAQREESRRLLVRLAVRRAGAWVRRPLDRAEVACSLASPATIERLAQGRIVAVSSDQVELVHEALLVHWPRLRAWLDQWTAVADLVDGLGAAARIWDGGGRHESDVLRGPRLQAALDWAAAAPEDVSALERDFLARSNAAAQGELLLARERADREARGRRRLRYVVAALAVATVAATAAAGVATRERSAQQRSARVADARRVAAQSLLAPDLRTSLLLAAAAYRLDPSDDSRGALLSALERSSGARWRVSTAGRDNFVGSDADGRTVWTMDTERRVYRLDVATRRVVNSFPAEADAIAAVAPNGAQLVATGQRNFFDHAGAGRVNILDANTGRPIAVLPVATSSDSGNQAAFTTDGRWLAVVQGAPINDRGDRPATSAVAVFDTNHYGSAAASIRVDSPVQWIAAAQDEIAVLTRSGTVYLIRASDRHVLASARRSDLAQTPDGSGPAAFAISPDGRHLAATATTDASLPYLLDTSDLSATPRVLERIDAGTNVMSFSPSSDVLAVGGGDGSVALYNPADAAVVARPLGEAPGQATHLAWSGSTTHDTGLYAAGRDSQLISLDVTTAARLVTLSGPAIDAPAEVFRDGNHLLRMDNTVTAHGRTVQPITVLTLDGHVTASISLVVPDNGSVQAVSVDAAADRALAITQDSRAVMHSSVIALPSGQVVTQFTATGTPSSHNLDVGVLAGDGRTAVYAVGDHTLAVYSMPGGTRLRTFDVHFVGPAGDRHQVSPFAFAPDGRLIVLGFDTYQSLVNQGDQPGPPEDQLVGLINVGNGRLDGQIGGFGEQSYVDAVDWSPDHRRVAIGTIGGTIRVVDARRLAPVSPVVHAVAGAVQTISFDPDGKTVVTGGDDGRLAFWDASTLQPIGAAVRGVRDDSWWSFYRSDGTVTGYAPSAVDGKERWFTLPAQPAAWLSAACGLAGDPLTRAEWTQAVGANRPYQKVC